MPQFLVTCPYSGCLKINRISHTHAERVVRCTYCRQKFTAPEYRDDEIPRMGQQENATIRFQAEPIFCVG